MTKNVVDAIIEANKEYNINIGFIPSRRQVDYNGGYVNNWTTKDFYKYVKSRNSKIILERDHGGPGQGFCMDDGKKSFANDCEFFDIIHIDPWKKYPKFEDGLRETIKAINLCHSINPRCYYEIGTEEVIRYFKSEELEKLIIDLRKNLSSKVFSKIIYVVVQSGVGLNLGDQINTGTFNPNRLKEMVLICKKYNLLSKEHNGDYLTVNEVNNRFKLGLDTINIAPEYGQLETSIYMDLIEKLPVSILEEFYRICYKSKRWKKWIKNDFNPIKEKNKIIKISGHYVFSNPEFLILKKKVADNLGISIFQLDNNIKTKIKNKIFTYKNIIN